VTLDLLGEEVDFKPGQYFFVTLPDVGHQDERGLRRHIAVVTSPNENGVLGFATRMRDSAFKRSLGELAVAAVSARARACPRVLRLTYRLVPALCCLFIK
jgi:hypothetical protein